MPELSTLWQAYARASHTEFILRDMEGWPAVKQACKAACNKYVSTLCHTKALHWKGWLEDITEGDIWHASRFASNGVHDGSACCIPTLFISSPADTSISEYSTPEDKWSLFASTFFPLKPTQVKSMPDDDNPFACPLPFSPPSAAQVQKCILNPHKALGPDYIPNLVLHNAINIFTPLLHSCLLASLSLNYFHKAWHVWITIILQKPNCPNYTTAKAYCPIALYNTMGKVITAVVTDMLIFLTVQQSILPSKCFGGLPG